MPFGGVYLTLATKESLGRIPKSRVFVPRGEAPLAMPGASRVVVALGDGLGERRAMRERGLDPARRP